MRRKVFIVMALVISLLCSSFILISCGGTNNSDPGGNSGGNSGGHTHNFATWTTVTKATCTEGGIEESICSCGERITKNTPATGHSFSNEWSFDEESHWHRATCEHKDEVADVEAHIFDSNNQCTICKYKVGNSIKLETPAISKIEYDTIYWNPVKNADTYTVYVNDNYERTLRGTSCDLEDVLWDGKPISKYGYIRVSVKANGHDDYIESDKSEENTSYYYVPENKSQSDKRDLLVKYSIGFGYNLIEDEYFDSTKCSGKSIFNVSKLLTIGDYTARPHSGGTGYSDQYKTIDEFISKTKISVEYKQEKGCVLLGSLKMQINADLGFDYRKYSFNNTYIYRYDWTYKDHAVTNFASDDLLKYCLADGFVQDVKRESTATYGMSDDRLFKYIFDTYGTHAIIGVTTGGSYTAQYVISTNEQDIAAKISAAFSLSTGGGGAIDQIIQKDFGIGISLDENLSWKGESTEAHFKTYIYGGSGGGATSASGVEKAIADWTGSLSEDNARSIALTENGAIAVTSLISFLGEIELANGYSDYVDNRADETYNILYKKYAKPTTVPASVQTENGKNVLRVDLSGFKTSASLQNAYHPNLINDVFTVYPVMYGKYIDKVVIVGGIDDASTSDKSLLPLTIRMDGSWTRSAEIVFENCGIECATNDNPVDISELGPETEPTIRYKGYNIIRDSQGKTVINFEQDNKNYSFVFDPNDDEEYNYNYAGVFGSSVYLPVATKSGYDFMGWKDSAGVSVSDRTGKLNSEYVSAIDGVIVIEAEWVNVCTVKLNNGGATTPGTGKLYTTDFETFYSDIECTEQIAVIEVPSKKGYTFCGYYPNSGSNLFIDTDGTILPLTGINSDIEVFASWISKLSFTLNGDGNSYSVSGIGSYDDSHLIIPSEYLGKPVTATAENAFKSCAIIKQITISDGVASIGNYSFAFCHNLMNISIPNSVKSIGDSAFEYCEGLTSVSIPNSVKSIKHSTFAYCYNLTSVTLPSGLTSIGGNAFFYCYSLTSIIIPASVTSIGYQAFSHCYRLIEVYNLSELAIEKGVESYSDIGYYALDIYTALSEKSKLFTDSNGYQFYENGATCYLLGYFGDETSLTIPESCNGKSYGIYNYAFCGTNFKCVTFTQNSKCISIGDFAFSNCTRLVSIVISDSMTSIGCDAFSNCSSLTSIIIPSNVKSIGNSAFRYCDGLTSMILPTGVEYIGDSVFEYCGGLTSITLPSSVTSVGNYAFKDCESLTSITIPAGVTSIGDYAFYNCTGLTSITLPASLTRIGGYAFYVCRKLASIKFNGTKPQWNAITKGHDWNYKTGNYTITCTDGTISK